MSRFTQPGYCEFCCRDEVSGLSWCVVCGKGLTETIGLDLGLRLLMDACADLNSATTHWLMTSKQL